MQAENSGIVSPPIMKLVRHELKRRLLTVETVQTLTPSMIRITLSSPELQDFVSLAPDDHVKIFVPDAKGETAMRDYTPRYFSQERGELVLDFAIHEAGPATQWAIHAKPGDQLEIAGPRGSRLIIGDVPHWVLIGDETALPAIGRRIEEAGQEESITAFITVAGERERQSLETRAKTDIIWIEDGFDSPSREAALLETVRAATIPADSFVWIAAEGSLARALREHFLEERGHSKFRIKAAGYWVRGEADAAFKFE